VAEDTLLLAGKLIEEMADPGAGFRESWRAKARPEQIPPPGRYRVWYLAGGRGGGKSWTGAHTLAEWILSDPEPGEWGIVAPIYADAWSVCVEGESGFLAALGTSTEEVKRGKSRLVEYWHRSFAEIKMRSGHIVRVASAEDGGLRIQGKNLKGAWCDEVGLWDAWKTTWDESLKYAVRKGESRIVATGTPKKSRKARELIRRLLADPAVRKSRLRTLDNRDNLSEAFLDEVVGSARGTRLEQQELEGVLLDDVEGALWTADGIDAYRADPARVPDLLRVVVAVDPAVSNEEDSDETGIVVTGEADGGHGFVLADYSMRGTPDACMRKAVWAYHHHQADKVIGEANNGGDYIGSLLRTVDANVPYEKVIATRGKRVRAEPVSALYEQGRMHHVGVHTMLEEQMISWVPSDPGDSPDRVDALCWSVAALRGLTSGSWLQAYGVKRCGDCGKAYPEREAGCPACHPEAPGAPAKPATAAPPEPQAIGGWASAYGDFVRCPACQRPYDTRRSARCPHCARGPLDYLRQHGTPAGAGIVGLSR
jgi:phage terminase large subunit-like protein